MQHASWLLIAVISIRQTSEKQPTYNYSLRNRSFEFTGQKTSKLEYLYRFY
jgi:hypothetical protein